MLAEDMMRDFLPNEQDLTELTRPAQPRNGPRAAALGTWHNMA